MTKKKKKDIPLLPLLSSDTMLIDTHCHLDMDDYQEDLDGVLQRAFDGGVKAVVTVGIDLESSEKAVKLAERFENVYATVGVHPHNVEGVSDKDYQTLQELAGQTRVVGYGEIGMDTVKLYSPVDLQIRHFEKQIVLGKNCNLPLIIHDREAHEPVMNILRKHAPFPAGGIMHCFSGDYELAEEVMALGFLVSIPGVVTFSKAEMLQDVVRRVPLAKLLLETDGPFLAPVPYRGKRNEPLFTLYTAQKVAELKGVSLDEVSRKTTENACRLLRVKI